MNNLFDLTGKVAIVTGASSGLGADAARGYADAGANVALFARRKEKLEGVAKELEAKGVETLVVECDVTDENQIIAGVQKVIDKFGKIDILLNNAGQALGGTVETIDEEAWDKHMAINLKAVYLMSKHVVPHMKKANYGKIVNVASINAIVADKPDSLARHAYNTSKAGVRGLTMGMAASFGQNNITVNSIGPGLFESEMTENTLFKHEGFMNAYQVQTPMSRPGRRGELNGTIIYLSSDASSYVTSQHIIIDGGFSIV